MLGDPYSLLYELEHHRGCFEILLLLHREGPVSKSRMRQRLRPGQRALEKSLRCLLRLGLVHTQTATRFPFATDYELTDRGRNLVTIPLQSWTQIFAV
jgi:DNA-binding HxlR family transcriptional regulator